MRNVVIGANSWIWRSLAADPRLVSWLALGHRDLSDFKFEHGDRVWLLAYSRTEDENTAMIDAVLASAASELIYVSSSSTIVARTTRCYEYPRVKHAAQVHAQASDRTRVLILGLVYDAESALPAGLTMAVSLESIARFMVQPDWPDDGGRAKRLFAPVQRPFGGAAERWAYQAYGAALRLLGPWPCCLRPVDLLLRAVGWRWYGYTYLSNQQWNLTTSS